MKGNIKCHKLKVFLIIFIISILTGCAGQEGEAPEAGTPAEEVEDITPAEEGTQTEVVTEVEAVTEVEVVTPVQEVVAETPVVAVTPLVAVTPAEEGAEGEIPNEEVMSENITEPAEPTEEGTPETDDFEKYLEGYKRAGKIESTVPEKMRVGETEIITAYITRNISENTVGEVEENQTHISSNIEVTPKMKVTLEGKQEEAFTVYPLTSDIQPITGQRTTIWKWRVTPQKSGKQALMMNVYLVIPSDSGETTSYIDELEKEIEVEVNPTYFVESNWQWIAGTLIGVPAFILTVLTLYGHIKKPKRK